MFLFAWSSGLCNIKEFQLFKLLLSYCFLSQAENSRGLLDIRIKASKGNRNKGRVLACDKLCKTFSLRFNLKLLFQYESTITKTPFSISKVPRIASAVIRSNGIVTKRFHITWMAWMLISHSSISQKKTKCFRIALCIASDRGLIASTVTFKF